MNTNVVIVVLLAALVAIGGIMLKNQTEDRNEKFTTQKIESEKKSREKIDNDIKTLGNIIDEAKRNSK